MRRDLRVALIASAGMGMALLTACSDSPTSVQPRVLVSGPSSVVSPGGDVTNDTPELGKLKICKAGNTGGSFDVTRQPVGGGTGTVSGLNTPIATGQCKTVADDNGGLNVGSDVFISEDAAPNTASSVTACVAITEGGATGPCPFNPASRFVNSYHGWVVTYTNTLTGGEGCTPGYWKQSQHFDSYPTPITPSTPFASVFGSGSGTFLQALQNGANAGINQLRRHGAAGYLNALSAGVDYDFTDLQVIAIVNGTGAYAALSIEARKDLLEEANEDGCPLN